MAEAVRARVIPAREAEQPLEELDEAIQLAAAAEDVAFQSVEPVDVAPGRPISYEEFGAAYVRRVLHKDRVLTMVNEVLGPELVLGPIGAGPGRSFASVSVVASFRPTKGEEVPGDLLTYRVFLPMAIVFDLDMKIDRHRFNADVVLPLLMRIHTEAPLRIRIDIELPAEDEIVLTLQTPTRRGAVLQKLTGLEGELRRFLLKVVRTELAKDYVAKATHLDMERLIDTTWGALSANFLPRAPEDRQA